MSFEFGDVVLVPFLFTDQTSSKKRPAVIVSSSDYQKHRSDLILMAVTSQLRPSPFYGELVIHEWNKAGLVKPSVIKPVIATVHRRLVLTNGESSKAQTSTRSELSSERSLRSPRGYRVPPIET